MNTFDEEKIFDRDAINLNILIRIILNSKKLVIKFTVISALVSIFISLLLPNIYISDALLVPNTSTQDVSLSSDPLSGPIALAGLGIGGLSSEANKTMIALETLKSRKFFADYLYDEILVNLLAVKKWDSENDQIIIDTDLYDKEKNKWLDPSIRAFNNKPSILEAHKEFLKIIDISEDIDKGGFIKISIEHLSPKIARDWVLLVVKSINEAMRQKDIDDAKRAIEFLVKQLKNNDQVALEDVFSGLIEEQTKTLMLANISDDYILSTIDPPVIMEKKSKPSRAFIVIASSLLGFICSIFFILVRRLV